MQAATQFRALLRGDAMIVAPGAYDAISALCIQQAGYPALYMTGSGTAAGLGFPDIGLVTMSEMVENAARIARSVSIPLIADADTGYGNALNVTRTVREYESRDVAGIHIEDQVTPKRCGHLDGKEIVPHAEFVSKIRAAVQARRNADFVIIARTDALAIEGVEGAAARARLYAQAGAAAQVRGMDRRAAPAVGPAAEEPFDREGTRLRPGGARQPHPHVNHPLPTARGEVLGKDTSHPAIWCNARGTRGYCILRARKRSRWAWSCDERRAARGCPASRPARKKER